MKLATMEVNYYLENPVMDIESEPGNYAYRYWYPSDTLMSELKTSVNWRQIGIINGKITCAKRRERDFKLKEQI